MKNINVIKTIFNEIKIVKHLGAYYPWVKLNDKMIKLQYFIVLFKDWNIEGSETIPGIYEYARMNDLNIDRFVAEVTLKRYDSIKYDEPIYIDAVYILTNKNKEIVFVWKIDSEFKSVLQLAIYKKLSEGYKFGMPPKKGHPDVVNYIYNKAKGKYVKQERLLYTNIPQLYKTQCRYSYVLKQNGLYLVKQRPDSKWVIMDEFQLSKHCKINASRLEKYEIEFANIDDIYKSELFNDIDNVFSCMWGKSLETFYTKYGATGIVLKKNGVWVARAIAWHYEGKVLVDRIYGKSKYHNVFLNLIKEAGYGYIYSRAKGFKYKNQYIKPIIKPINDDMNVFYPFMDSIKLMDENGILYMEKPNALYILNKTDGKRQRYTYYDVDGNVFNLDEIDQYVYIKGNYYKIDDERIICTFDKGYALKSECYQCYESLQWYTDTVELVKTVYGYYVHVDFINKKYVEVNNDIYALDDERIAYLSYEDIYTLKENCVYSTYYDMHINKEYATVCSKTGIIFDKRVHDHIVVNDHVVLEKFADLDSPSLAPRRCV